MAQGIGDGMEIAAVISLPRFIGVVGQAHRIVDVRARPIDCGDLAVAVVGVRGGGDDGGSAGEAALLPGEQVAVSVVAHGGDRLLARVGNRWPADGGDPVGCRVVSLGGDAGQRCS